MTTIRNASRRRYVISPYTHRFMRDSSLSNLSRERLEIYFNDLYHILISQIATLPGRDSLTPTEEARITWLLGQILEVKKALIHRFIVENSRENSEKNKNK